MPIIVQKNPYGHNHLPVFLDFHDSLVAVPMLFCLLLAVNDCISSHAGTILFLRADSSCRPMPVTGSTFVLLLTWGIIPVGHVYGITGEHMKKSNYTKWDQNYIKLHYPPKKNGQQFNTKHEKFMAFMFAPFFTHTSQAFIRQKLSSLQTFARTATMQVFLGLFETRVRKSNRFSSFPHSNVNFRSTFFRI